jgi:hypothetical protein
MGEGAIMPVESIATPGSGHLKLIGSLDEVRPELAHPILTENIAFLSLGYQGERGARAYLG